MASLDAIQGRIKKLEHQFRKQDVQNRDLRELYARLAARRGIPLSGKENVNQLHRLLIDYARSHRRSIGD